MTIPRGGKITLGIAEGFRRADTKWHMPQVLRHLIQKLAERTELRANCEVPPGVSDDGGHQGGVPLRPCLESAFAAANSTGSINIASASSGMRIATGIAAGINSARALQGQ